MKQLGSLAWNPPPPTERWTSRSCTAYTCRHVHVHNTHPHPHPYLYPRMCAHTCTCAPTHTWHERTNACARMYANTYARALVRTRNGSLLDNGCQFWDGCHVVQLMNRQPNRMFFKSIFHGACSTAGTLLEQQLARLPLPDLGRKPSLETDKSPTHVF